jgi:hypothetical protein
MGFVNELTREEPRPAQLYERSLPGTLGHWPTPLFEQEYLVVHYKLRLKQTRAVLVTLNTHQECALWIDGVRVLENQGGSMQPSFHRPLKEQITPCELSQGEHNLTVALRRPATDAEAEWVVGLGDPQTRQWIPDAFVMTGA